MSRMFANGTEGSAWLAVWCDICDHEPDCPHLDHIWAEYEPPPVITLEPEGTFHLPALHVCSEFTNPNDPHAGVRANVRAVTLNPRRHQ